MARGGSLLWWVTAVISRRMITGSPLTVYNCWRPRESLSTNKPRDKRQHADEESTTGVKVFRAQSRLTKKPVQSATTCLTRCISGAEAEVTPVITVWLADRHQREAETEPHHNLLRGSRAGRSRRSQRASWRNIPAKSASAVVPPGWESQGICSKWRAAKKSERSTAQILRLHGLQYVVMTLQSAVWNVKAQMKKVQRTFILEKLRNPKWGILPLRLIKYFGGKKSTAWV